MDDNSSLIYSILLSNNALLKKLFPWAFIEETPERLNDILDFIEDVENLLSQNKTWNQIAYLLGDDEAHAKYIYFKDKLGGQIYE